MTLYLDVMKNKLFLFLIICLLSACRDCEDTGEPTLVTYFDDGSSYEKVYGLGGADTLPMNYEIPIAINSDSSIYILFNAEKTDTLGISYKRVVKYESKECGFSVTLDSFKLLEISTFDSAEFKIYEDNKSYFLSSSRNSYEVALYR